MRILKRLLIAIGLLISGLVAFAFALPNQFNVARSQHENRLRRTAIGPRREMVLGKQERRQWRNGIHCRRAE